MWNESYKEICGVRRPTLTFKNFYHPIRLINIYYALRFAKTYQHTGVYKTLSFSTVS